MEYQNYCDIRSTWLCKDEQTDGVSTNLERVTFYRFETDDGAEEDQFTARYWSGRICHHLRVFQ